MNPRVAVVIPLYNHERYIARAIESAINQTVMPARIIVIDDGSSDGSVAAARAVAHPIVEIHQQPNQGAHATLNRSVAMAEDCEFVAILNSDDLHHAPRYEVCLAEMAADPTIQLVCTALDLVDADGQPLPAQHPRSKWFTAAWSPLQNPPPLMEWLGLANFPGTTSNFFARRQWLINHPFRNYRYAHDYYHLLEAALFEGLKIVPERLLSYRIHESNTISTRPSALIREMLRMNADFLRAYPPQDSRMLYAIRDYLRASWNNVSAFRQDLFTLLMCRAFAHSPPSAVEEWIDEVARFPEAAEFPNRQSVNTLAEGEILGAGLALAEKLEDAKKKCTSLKGELRKTQDNLRSAQQRLRSRSDALRRFFGRKEG